MTISTIRLHHEVGTIGAGAGALAFARNALSAGHEVVLSNRHGPESLVGKIVAECRTRGVLPICYPAGFWGSRLCQ